MNTVFWVFAVLVVLALLALAWALSGTGGMRQTHPSDRCVCGHPRSDHRPQGVHSDVHGSEYSTPCGEYSCWCKGFRLKLSVEW